MTTVIRDTSTPSSEAATCAMSGLLAGARIGAAERTPDLAVRADVDAALGAVRVLVGARAAHVHGDGDAHAAPRAPRARFSRQPIASRTASRHSTR